MIPVFDTLQQSKPKWLMELTSTIRLIILIDGTVMIHDLLPEVQLMLP